MGPSYVGFQPGALELEPDDAAFLEVALVTDCFTGALVTGFALTEAFFFALVGFTINYSLSPRMQRSDLVQL